MKDFKKYYFLPANTEDVFAAITNPFTIELWTGYKAVMNDVEGTEFSLWEGDIVGKNIEIEKNKKLVQQWYFGDDLKEKSMVTIKLFEKKKGTEVELNHINIPDEDFENITEGWNDYYFGALKIFFEIE